MDDVAKELIKLRHDQEEKVAQMLAAKLKLPYVNLLLYQISPETLKVVPKDEVIRHQIIAYLRVGKHVTVATPVPITDQDRLWLEKYFERLGYTLTIQLCSSSSFAAAIKQYDRIASEVNQLQSSHQSKVAVDFNQVIQSVNDVAKQIKKVSTSDLFSVIMAGALNTGSSDIHIEPAEASVRLRYRIDGVLQDVTQLTHEQYAALLSRIKVLAHLKLDVDDKPQDGRFEYQSAAQTVDLRTSTLPSPFGEVIVLRLLVAGVELKTLNDLEFNDGVLAKIHEAISKPHGMIINTGPTGSGKTTTLYAIIETLNEPGVKIITIEDPIEYRLTGIDQTQIDQSAGYSFALGLKGALRQDPDIIMVGEIRDPETAKIALQAALTGHLVVTTLHANTAAAALPRLLDMGVEPFLLAGSINLIIAQRLVRKICLTCRGTGLLVTSSLVTGNTSESATSHQETSNQCRTCQGARYRGRTPIVEALAPTHEFNELIARKATVEEFEQKAKDLGMKTMYEDGMDKVAQGITTQEEIERVTRE